MYNYNITMVERTNIYCVLACAFGVAHSMIIRSCICHYMLSLQPPAMEKEEELNDVKARAQVRLVLWLGMEKDQQNWKECCGDGEITLHAETVSYYIITSD